MDATLECLLSPDSSKWLENFEYNPNYNFYKHFVLKIKIESTMSIPQTEQRIIYNHKELLDDSKTLEQYDFQNESKIMIVMYQKAN